MKWVLAVWFWKAPCLCFLMSVIPYSTWLLRMCLCEGKFSVMSPEKHCCHFLSQDQSHHFLSLSQHPTLCVYASFISCFFSHQDSKKTLKRTRKFLFDGVEVSVTTSKVISDDEKKDEEMRFLRQVSRSRFSFSFFISEVFQNRKTNPSAI